MLRNLVHKLTIPVLFFLVLLLGVGGLVLWPRVFPSIPYTFITDQLTANYLEQKERIGEYEFFETSEVASNPLVSPDGKNAVGFLTKGGVQPRGDDLATIIVNSDLQELENIMGILKGADCVDKYQDITILPVGGKVYQGYCDINTYYGYLQEGGRWILFNSQLGAGELATLIQAYIAE